MPYLKSSSHIPTVVYISLSWTHSLICSTEVFVTTTPVQMFSLRSPNCQILRNFSVCKMIYPWCILTLQTDHSHFTETLTVFHFYGRILSLIFQSLWLLFCLLHQYLIYYLLLKCKSFTALHHQSFSLFTSSLSDPIHACPWIQLPF